MIVSMQYINVHVHVHVIISTVYIKHVVQHRPTSELVSCCLYIYHSVPVSLSHPPPPLSLSLSLSLSISLSHLSFLYYVWVYVHVCACVGKGQVTLIKTLGMQAGLQCCVFTKGPSRNPPWDFQISHTGWVLGPSRKSQSPKLHAPSLARPIELFLGPVCYLQLYSKGYLQGSTLIS